MRSKKPLVIVKNVAASYGGKQILREVSFNVHEGEIFVIVGPNGSGKTTLLRTIAGVLPILRGDIIIANKSIKNDPIAVKSSIGYMIEGDRVYGEFTALDNVVMFAKFYSVSNAKEKAVGLLNELGLGENLFIKAEKLSLGQKRKLSLARAIIHDPLVLLLDEPTSNLDPSSAFDVRNRLKKLAEKKAVILCTHNLYESQEIASKMGIMINGTLDIGTPTELVKRFPNKIGDNKNDWI
ncbi:MAG: Trehalose/maltose import ATP-binding protein MalK [Candidatus Bathyarchaeota archaeon BA2]|nr:MAG: Trehalose/maltose import ATP-binding protein MalK [Candidatus Bathyarchaeota archaeon BA2]